MITATAAVIVALVVGHPFPVACAQTPNQDLGVTTFVGGQPVSVTILPEECSKLRIAYWKFPYAGYELAVALQAVVHEANHVLLESEDEALVQACALADLPWVASRIVGFGAGDALERFLGARTVGMLVAGAAAYSRLLPAAYQGGVCPPVGV